MKRILTALLPLILLTSCSLAGKTYHHYNITFTYPRGWNPMSEVSQTYESEREFLWMGLLENLTVTSVKQPGEPGAYFSVASLERSDGVIDADIDYLYARNEADMRNYVQRPITVAGIEGLSATYERLWQNQWLQFHDVWLEYGSLFYLLSYRAEDLSLYQSEMEMILESFSFQ
jgi:hypothetical protein